MYALAWVAWHGLIGDLASGVWVTRFRMVATIIISYYNRLAWTCKGGHGKYNPRTRIAAPGPAA